jgi:uncharacterized protein YdbL (DUF1318 family)
MIKKFLAYPAMLLVLAACVTINIYFPAAAAEEAARTIVRDVLQGEEGAPPQQEQQAPPADDQQSAADRSSLALVMVGRLLEVLVPPAHAAKADININTPAINAIRRSMEQRQRSLAPYYRSGAIGFDRNGTVSIRDLNAVSLAERNKLKKLVADENQDRAALYREIARANGHPEWEGEVRSTFARVWLEEALPGYWYQDPSGKWRQR